jgi:hypothetical protein
MSLVVSPTTLLALWPVSLAMISPATVLAASPVLLAMVQVVLPLTLPRISYSLLAKMLEVPPLFSRATLLVSLTTLLVGSPRAFLMLSPVSQVLEPVSPVS